MTKNLETELKKEECKTFFDWIKGALEMIGKKDLEVLEIGAGWGISTNAFLSSGYVKHLMSVDIVDCSLACDEVEELGKQDQWTFIKGDSTILLPHMCFNKGKEEYYDLIFIDGDHSRSTASKDLWNSWALLKPGGHILMDDILQRSNFVSPQSGLPASAYYGVARALWGFIYSKQITVQLLPSFSTLALIKKNE